MDIKNVYSKIKRDETLMETISHGNEAYPFGFYDETMDMFDFRTVDWHWHNEFEFVLVESGCVNIYIDQDELTLHAGEGVFINSKVLHRFLSDNNAAVPNFLCSPAFFAPLDSLIYQKYVLPIINSSTSYILFSKNSPRKNQVLSLIIRVISLQREEVNQKDCVRDDFDAKNHDKNNCDPKDSNHNICAQELQTSMLLQNILLSLIQSENFAYSMKASASNASSTARLQLMMQYIQDHYREALTLNQIATHVLVSKSTALNLFRNHLQTTPIDYLIRYRLKQAALLLSGTEKKVAAISKETGFENVDYFCRTFKKHYNVTPTQYRNLKSAK